MNETPKHAFRRELLMSVGSGFGMLGLALFIWYAASLFAPPGIAIDEIAFHTIKPGMTLDEVEGIIGGPPRDYTNGYYGVITFT